jgi:hypothetical protein
MTVSNTVLLYACMPPPVSSLFSPSFRLFGVDSYQCDTTPTRSLGDVLDLPRQ